MKTNFYQFNFLDLKRILVENDLNPAAARLLFRHYYKDKKLSFCEHHNLSKSARHFIENNFSFNLPAVLKTQISEDQTVKLLFQLHDGLTIESVLLPFSGKYTLCLSTQVGCAMNCSFCFTGTQGLKRNLTADEMIGQFIQAWKWLEENRPDGNFIRNLVYMGQGEPLHNFDAVKKATEIFIDNHGASLGIQRITISTSGYIPGLKRLKEEMPDVNIALSLHSTFDEKRNILIPINERFPVLEVINYLDQIQLRKKQFITYEFLLIKNFNDNEVDAHALGELLKNRKAIINLIPFNPIPGTKFEKPDFAVTQKFMKILESYKIPTMIRSTKGDEILAACGQLNTVT
jgi:23S rRNA (adenine2503-C2)-methyltransferase